jgi:tartrate dehydratase alpha subunit/fumarate hydratase class I-like protein
MIDKERMANAVKEIFLACDTTPPDEYIQQISALVTTPEAKAQANEAIQAIKEQYINIGTMVKEKIEEAVRKGKSNG